MTHKVVSISRCFYDVKDDDEAIEKFLIDMALGFYDSDSFEVADCNCDE